jgi:hypothetical protein
MGFTKTCIVVLVAGCLLLSCKNKKTVVPAKPTVKTLSGNSTFIFSEKEQALFQLHDAPVKFNLDTLYRRSQMGEFKQTIPYETIVACAFTYRDGSLPKTFHALYRKNRTYSWVPNAQKMLFIQVADTAVLSRYSGGYLENDPDPQKIDSVVCLFFEKAYAIDAKDNKNAGRYRKPVINLCYDRDDYRGVTKFYSAIARGYILFQRKNSQAIFGKPIDSLNSTQLKQLAAAVPLMVLFAKIG